VRFGGAGMRAGGENGEAGEDTGNGDRTGHGDLPGEWTGASGAAEPDWRGYTSEQQQRSVLAVEQDAEAINKRYYDSAFEEFLPELEQLELSLAQPVVAV
ncbi:hypothetical protein, partial [Pseudomonas aeruginosa]|uniref:hypothetical protein n=1 Tax=Pseudomonas aeruginosa TaxID=287 RepID=UPI0024B83ACA